MPPTKAKTTRQAPKAQAAAPGRQGDNEVIESDDDGPLTKLSSDFFGRPAKVARTAETSAGKATAVHPAEASRATGSGSAEGAGVGGGAGLLMRLLANKTTSSFAEPSAP